jgi:hypothetical protein
MHELYLWAEQYAVSLCSGKDDQHKTLPCDPYNFAGPFTSRRIIRISHFTMTIALTSAWDWSLQSPEDLVRKKYYASIEPYKD